MINKKLRRIISMVLILVMTSSNMVFATGSDYEGENHITRAEFVSMVNLAFGLTEESDITYKDIKESHSLYDDFRRANAAGYMVGYEDGTIRPNDKITRQEVAAVVARLLNLKENKNSELFLALNDLEEIPQWSAGAVSTIVHKGYMKLRMDYSFAPYLPATRAEVIDVLDNAYLNFVKPAEDGLSGVDSNYVEWETVVASYNYCFPLLIMNATKEKMTNVTVPSGSQAPINQLAHAKGLADASSFNVVTPNTDTIYSQAFIDLKDKAMVLVKPKVDRFFTIQVMDAYTNTVKILGTGGDTQDERIYLLTGPDYQGQLPSNMVHVSMPQNMGWILGRIICKGQPDLENVYAIQEQFKLLPLEDYLLSKDYTPPKGDYNEEYNFVPVNHILQMTPKEFFDTANQLMLDNPPSEVDHKIMSLMETINVGPGKVFHRSILGEDGEANWKAMIGSFKTNSNKAAQHFNVNIGQWKYLGKPISEFGREYTYRALVALGGLGANPVSAAIYSRVDLDNNGEHLNGSHSYTIHFEKDCLPKTDENGFWSITAYNQSNFLIDNPLNRYDINDRDNLKFNKDGSLDLMVQESPPTDPTMEGNWLPVSKDEFHLFMRIYLPHEDVLSGNWEAPTITKN